MNDLLPAYQGNDPFMFVCYAHADQAVVSAELWSLHEQGINIWYDEGISPGHVFTDEIANRISQCSTFLYFVSPSSVASRNCQNEVQFASARDKRIVAIHLEPTELSGGLELQIGLAQAIFKYQLAPEDFQRKLASVFSTEQMPPSVSARPLTSKQPPAGTRGRPGLLALGMIALLLVGVALGAWYFQERATTTSSIPSIAVLPFSNLSANAENNYLAEGIAEDILNGLSRVEGLFVIPRRSSFNYRGDRQDVNSMGRALGALHVLEGSVRRMDNRVRINVSLIDTTTERQTWSDQYDRDMSDVFAVQDEISQAVQSALRVRLMPAAPRQAIAPEAYDAYLKGRARGLDDWREARADFERAIAIEPDYADAHAALAWTFIDSIPFGRIQPVKAYAGAQLSIGKALAIEPDHMEALFGRALILGTVNHDYQSQLDTFVELAKRGAQHSRYNFTMFEVLRLLGRCDIGLPLMDAWIRADPLNNAVENSKVNCLIWLGRLDEARQAVQEANESIGLQTRWRLALKSGDADELARLVEELRQAIGSEPWGWRSLLHYAEGNLEQSRADALRELEVNPKSVEALVMSDQLNSAVELIERALDDRNFLALYWMVPEPGSVISQKFHAHPDVQRLRKKAKLDDASLAKLVFRPLVTAQGF